MNSRIKTIFFTLRLKKILCVLISMQLEYIFFMTISGFPLDYGEILHTILNSMLYLVFISYTAKEIVDLRKGHRTECAESFSLVSEDKEIIVTAIDKSASGFRITSLIPLTVGATFRLQCLSSPNTYVDTLVRWFDANKLEGGLLIIRN